MPTDRQIARQISYAHSAQGPGGRAIIRALETATGRIGLIRRAAGYETEIAAGADFWQVMVDRYGLALDVVHGTLSNIPADGPLVVVANHPYGILDGLILGHLLAMTRGDFRILAHKVFLQARELENVILPVNFDESKAAMAENLAVRKTALDYLGQGGAIGIFPGGTVSTSATPMGRPMDPSWRSFTARMVARSGATVVPVYFDGANSRLFQLASHLHYTLRMGLLIREFKRQTDKPVRISIGKPIDPGEIAARARDPRVLMDFLRKSTYALSPTPCAAATRGFEFDAAWKRREG